MKTDSKRNCNSKGRAQNGTRTKREQPRKDSKSARVNFDNERESKFERKYSVDNDPQWYFNKAQLAESATRINFVHTTGMREVVPNGTSASNYNAVPGVLTLLWDPIINGSGRIAIKQAADSQYSYVVHANSRNYSYNAQDQMILELGTALLYSFIANGIRAYGVMENYDGIDLYTPQALVTAMGFDFADLKANYSHMLFDINQIIAQTTQLWVPNTMPIFERWFWLNTNIYRDGNSTKSQYYMFVPATYYTYNETGTSRGATLDAVEWNTTAGRKWSEFVTIAQNMVTQLVNSEDRGTILGDILNAYKAERIYKLNPIAYGYKTPIVYDQEVLTQIENASIFCGQSGTIVADVENGLYSQGTTYSFANAASQSPGVGSHPILNFHQKEAPTPEQIMVATRLSLYGTVCTNKTETLVTISPGFCGTEIIANACVYYYTWANGVRTLNQTWYNQFVRRTNAQTNISTGFIYQWTTFDWAPWIVIQNQLTAEQWQAAEVNNYAPISTIYAIGDYDNYVFLDRINLEQLHTAAIYSLFDVPVTI